MSNRFLATLSLALLLVGCVSNDYTGKTYAPTDNVEIFYAETDVGRDYEVMGTDRATASDSMSSQDIVAKMVDEAKKRGADGIIVDNVDTRSIGSSSSSYGDDNRSTVTNDMREKVITARFIKYRS